MQKRGIPILSKVLENLRVHQQYKLAAVAAFSKGSVRMPTQLPEFPTVKLIDEDGQCWVHLVPDQGLMGVRFSLEAWRRMENQVREATEPAKRALDTHQQNAVTDLAGLRDQIEKQQWLNVHFRAFRLANEAWSNHARVCADRAHTGEQYEHQHEEAKAGPTVAFSDDADGVTVSRCVSWRDRSIEISISNVKYQLIPEVLALMQEAERLSKATEAA